MTIMSIPFGFKIRKKTDVDTFINECMIAGNEYTIISLGIKIITLAEIVVVRNVIGEVLKMNYFFENTYGG